MSETFSCRGILKREKRKRQTIWANNERIKNRKTTEQNKEINVKRNYGGGGKCGPPTPVWGGGGNKNKVKE